MRRSAWIALGVAVLLLGGFVVYRLATTDPHTLDEDNRSLEACADRLAAGFRRVASDRSQRFLGKVEDYTALCRGGDKAAKYRDTPWIDWANYWAVGDETSRAKGIFKSTGLGSPDERGIFGALLDLEYQRVELIKFNLFDNYTYQEYVQGVDLAAYLKEHRKMEPKQVLNMAARLASAASCAERGDLATWRP